MPPSCATAIGGVRVAAGQRRRGPAGRTRSSRRGRRRRARTARAGSRPARRRARSTACPQLVRSRPSSGCRSPPPASAASAPTAADTRRRPVGESRRGSGRARTRGRGCPAARARVRIASLSRKPRAVVSPIPGTRRYSRSIAASLDVEVVERDDAVEPLGAGEVGGARADVRLAACRGGRSRTRRSPRAASRSRRSFSSVSSSTRHPWRRTLAQEFVTLAVGRDAEQRQRCGRRSRHSESKVRRVLTAPRRTSSGAGGC